MFGQIILILILLIISHQSEAANELTECPKLIDCKSCFDIGKHGLQCIWCGSCVRKFPKPGL